VNYFIRHWSFDPMIIGVVATIVAHEIGLRRLATHSSLARQRRRRRSSWYFYSGLATLLVSVVSPIDYWSSSYFFVHMIQHVLLSFAAPILIVAGAPWIPFMFTLPVVTRRRVGRYFYLSSKARGFRAVGRFIRSPWTALVSFNAAMLLWHIPSWFELAEANQTVHIWLMHGSFIVTGVLFWLQVIPSYPMKPARGPYWQAGSILATNVIMTILAMSMSILTTVSWYASYSNQPGVTFSPFADQQIGAGILWICGDFWALPAVFLIIRRAIEDEGSIAGVIDRVTGRRGDTSAEDFRRARLAATLERECRGSTPES
jgi:putative membrane protein